MLARRAYHSMEMVGRIRLRLKYLSYPVFFDFMPEQNFEI